MKITMKKSFNTLQRGYQSVVLTSGSKVLSLVDLRVPESVRRAPDALSDPEVLPLH